MMMMATLVTKQMPVPSEDDSSTCYEDCRMTPFREDDDPAEGDDDSLATMLEEADDCRLHPAEMEDRPRSRPSPLLGAPPSLNRMARGDSVRSSEIVVDVETFNPGSSDVPCPRPSPSFPGCDSSGDGLLLAQQRDSGEIALGDEIEVAPELRCEGIGHTVALDETGIDAAMDAVLEEEEDETFATQPASAAPEAGVEQRFGGLVNLGNSCYMASALQALAAVEEFVQTMRDEELPNATAESSKLRDAFLDVMMRLKRGETFRPDNFKRIVDDRTPLFVGFQQQDSHEFVTTLLDLIDEDYKKRPGSEKVEFDSVPEESATTHHRKELAELTTDGTFEPDEKQEVSKPEFSRKKARTGELGEACISQDLGPSATTANASPPASPTGWLTTSCRNSFSELNLEEIGHLLHETNPPERDSIRISSSAEHRYHPRYKLVGGRMNTADVVLTPYASAMVTDDSSSVTSSVRAGPDPLLGSPSGAAITQPCTSPVDKLFKLSARVRLTCDSCKYSRCHEESFLHLSLEIGPGCGSVEDGLRRFFSPETREIKCEKCFAESATQTMEIMELPKVLLMHFKRFIVEVSSDYSSVSYRKNQSIMAFDHEIELDGEGSAFCNFLAHDCVPTEATRASLRYRIRCVVNHMGASANCGHYTTDAYRLYQNGSRGWTRFNDSILSRVSATDATENSQRTAYLLLYELE